MKDSIYNKTVLKNDIRVITERISHVRSVSLGVFVTHGARDESREENGISHMIEHMVFKGTQKRTAKDIAISLESLGGHLDAFTSKEETCYYARVLDEHVPLAVDVISDIATHSLFSEKDLEKEKKVVLEEIKGVEDSPDDLVFEILGSALFEGHPLGQTVLGPPGNCKRWTGEKLRSYWSEHYHTPSVIVAGAGSVGHSELVKLAEQAFEFPKGEPKRNDGPLPEFRPKAKIRRKKITQAHLALGCRTFPFTDPRRFALLILATILGGGMSSRLFQTVREKEGLAYAVFTYTDFFQDTGMFGIYLGVDPQKVLDALRLVLKEVETLRQEGISVQDLEDAKQQIKGNMMLGLESTSNRMMRLARMEMTMGKYVTLDDTIAEIDGVTREQVLAVARELIDPRRLSLAALGPLREGKIDLGELL
jgi:predicted Zn-dependent peptidase